MTKWICRCGNDFQSDETFLVECPRCGEILYCLPTCGNFNGFCSRPHDDEPHSPSGPPASSSDYRS